MDSICNDATAAMVGLETPEGAVCDQPAVVARRGVLTRSTWMQSLKQHNGLLAIDALRQRTPHCPKTLAGYVQSFSSQQR